MEIYEQNAKSVVDNLGSFIDVGLTSKSALERIKKYGENKLTKQKKKGFFRRLIECLTEPMILILHLLVCWLRVKPESLITRSKK